MNPRHETTYLCKMGSMCGPIWIESSMVLQTTWLSLSWPCISTLNSIQILHQLWWKSLTLEGLIPLNQWTHLCHNQTHVKTTSSCWLHIFHFVLWLSSPSYNGLPHHHGCCNPSFGLTTKAKGLQGYGPKGSPGVKAKRLQGCKPIRSLGVISHTPGNVRKFEGVWGSEPSHSQSNSHFGKWSPGELLKLQRVIWKVKTQWLVAFFI
jgi:hypothetical protein